MTHLTFFLLLSLGDEALLAGDLHGFLSISFSGVSAPLPRFGRLRAFCKSNSLKNFGLRATLHHYRRMRGDVSQYTDLNTPAFHHLFEVRVSLSKFLIFFSLIIYPRIFLYPNFHAKSPQLITDCFFIINYCS